LKRLSLLFALPMLAAFVALAPQSTEKTHAAYVYEVYMYGDNVVPSVNTSIYGFLRFFFNDTMTEADVTVDVKGVSNTGVTGADIRAGKPGTNGPVVFHLSDGDFIVTSTRIKLTPADLQHMVNGDWYGVLYTSYHPQGEIRAQLNLPPEAVGASPPPPPAHTSTQAPLAPPPGPAPTAVPPTTGGGGAVISPPNTGSAGLR
jgi:hypothetical protein